MMKLMQNDMVRMRWEYIKAYSSYITSYYGILHGTSYYGILHGICDIRKIEHIAVVTSSDHQDASRTRFDSAVVSVRTVVCLCGATPILSRGRNGGDISPFLLSEDLEESLSVQ